MLSDQGSGSWQARAIAWHSVRSTSLHLPLRLSKSNVLILEQYRYLVAVVQEKLVVSDILVCWWLQHRKEARWRQLV